MGAFKSAVITKKGHALLAKIVQGGTKLEFTQIKTSENVLSGDLASLTNIGTVKQAEKIASIVKQGEYSVKVSASFTNDGRTAGYYIRNIGLYAMDPTEGEILYSISVADENIATADWMPPNNGASVSSLMVDLITTVSSASQVNLLVDSTATATVAQLREVNEHLEALDNSITTTTERALSGSVAGGVKINKVLGKCVQEAEPTPDTPQEIKYAKVEKIKSIGKNLLPFPYVSKSKTELGITWTINEDHSITVVGTATGDTSFILSENIEWATTSFYSIYSAKTIGEYTFSDCGDYQTGSKKLYYFISKGVTINKTYYPMINKGSKALPYEPYTENSITFSAPFHLEGVGDVSDTIVYKDGSYWIESAVYKKVFTGDEEIETQTSDVTYFACADTAVALNTHEQALTGALCTRLEEKTPNQLWGDRDIGFAINTSSWNPIRFRFGEDITSVEAAKALLKSWYDEGNPMILYAKKAVPTFEQVPVEDQLALRSLLSYDGVTNLVTDSEVEPIVEVEYGTNKVGAHTLTGLLTAQRNEIKIANL